MRRIIRVCVYIYIYNPPCRSPLSVICLEFSTSLHPRRQILVFRHLVSALQCCHTRRSTRPRKHSAETSPTWRLSGFNTPLASPTTSSTAITFSSFSSSSPWSLFLLFSSSLRAWPASNASRFSPGPGCLPLKFSAATRMSCACSSSSSVPCRSFPTPLFGYFICAYNFVGDNRIWVGFS